MKEKEIKQNSLYAWLLAARPKTLSGAAVPVMIGTALTVTEYLANPEYVCFSTIAAVLCFLFAMVMQIDANFVNDLFDYLKGDDDGLTRLGPRRACAEGWITVHAMKVAVVLTTTIACLIGLPLIIYGGVEMILVGLACVVFCFLYSTFFSRRGLGDVLVLVFFGIVPICTIYYIQIQELSWTAFFMSVACGLVINSLLMVNNYRDRDNDWAVGKYTLAVTMQEKHYLLLYLAMGIVPCLIGLMLLPKYPLATLLPLIYLKLHVQTYRDIKRIRYGKPLNKCLGQTARNIFIYGLCVSIGLLIRF